ncbi:MAG TPA: hypothetical protein PKO06_00245 [Candidatus Ozemobacteraceae bacterium]|nr:hypothetical protein [Candidatus Ozemobacteraceae bacterium]
MIDLRKFLEDNKRLFDPNDGVEKEKARIVASRNELLAKARGSLRQHLQQQLSEALRRFQEEEVPSDPRQLS